MQCKIFRLFSNKIPYSSYLVIVSATILTCSVKIHCAPFLAKFMLNYSGREVTYTDWHTV